MSRQKSLAKVEANRKNAQRSTGPTTDQGKAIVKWNALRHGLLSKEVVVAVGDGKESTQEFEDLLQGFVEELRPDGALEEMLVDKIAASYWRLRRVVRCEIGEIRRHTDCFHHNRAERATDDTKDAFDFAATSLAKRDLTKSPVGVENLLRLIQRLRKDVEERGFFTDEACEEATASFDADGFRNDLLFCNAFADEEHRDEALEDWEPDGETPSPDHCRKEILRLLAWKKRELQRVLPALRERERLETESELCRLSLPPENVTDRILRYETAIERGLYRGIHELQRLQSARIGQNVPVPLVLDVDMASDSD